MILLILGLVLFIAVHLIPSSQILRSGLVDKLSLSGYKAVFNIVSVLSVVLIVIGLKQAPFQILYQPPLWGQKVAILLMFPAIYLFFSNSIGPAPSSAKTITAHPLNWSVILWSISHLLANGDLAHVILFSALLGFSIVSIYTGNLRGLKPVLLERPPIVKEAVFVIVVAIIYFILVWSHVYYTGVPVI